MLVMRKEISGYGQNATPTPVIQPTTSVSGVWASLGMWRYLIGGFAAWYIYKTFFQSTY